MGAILAGVFFVLFVVCLGGWCYEGYEAKYNFDGWNQCAGIFENEVRVSYNLRMKNISLTNRIKELEKQMVDAYESTAHEGEMR